MDSPTVSVVMCVYNGERYLAEAIESILQQTMKDFEFIIVDDGSTDGTADILRRCAAADDRVRVVTRPHEGIIGAANHGCGLAKGRYIARMDADDVALPDRLAKQVAFLDAHPNVAVVGGAIQMINDRGVILETISLPQKDREIKELLPRQSAIANVTALLQREVFREVGGYRRAFAYAEDYDLWLRVADQHELANLPDLVMRCRTHPESISVRFRKQQILSTLGAQVSAQVRKESGRDPLDGVDLVTPEVLYGLGVDEWKLSEVLADHYIRTANRMARAGRPDEALAVFRWALKDTRSRRSRRKVRAGIYWEYANIAAQQRRFAVALGAVARACALDPTSSKRLLRRLRRRAA